MRVISFLMVLISIQSFCQKTEKIKLDKDLSISTTLDTLFFFGETDTNFEVVLTTSGKSKRIFDLETGLITFALQQKFPDGKIYQYSATRGGPDLYYSSSGYGTIEYNHKVIEQREITLKKYDTLKKQFNIHEIFKRNLDPAIYSLTITYENKAVSKTTFKVICDYKNGIPLLLSLLNSEKTVADLSPLNLFFYLTDRPEWFPELRFEYEKHWQRAGEIISWWNSNKEIFLHIEEVLKKRNYVSVDFDTIIPELSDQLQFGDYRQRLLARDSLVNLVGFPEWIPGADDSPEKINHEVAIFRKWWSQNRTYIIHANLILSQNVLILDND